MKHIVVGCTILSPSEYTNRHNKVAGYIHWPVCKYMGLEVTDSYCEHTPERVIMSTVPLLCETYRLSQIERY
jgi:hypothetical protein